MNKRIKLIYIMQEFSPDVGGWAFHLFNELSKYIEVVVLAQPYSHSIKESNKIEVINPNFKIIRYEGYILKGMIYPIDLKSILEIERNDTCIVQMDEFFKFYTIIASKWCRENDIPYIISSRMRYRKGIIRDFAILFFRELAIDAVFFSKKIIATQGVCSREEFKRWFFFKNDSNFEIIPSGIDIKKINVNRKINFFNNKKIILCVARIYHIKRIDLLLKIFMKVLEYRDDVELWIVGKEDKNELLKLKKIINKYNIKNVNFLGGKPNDELYKYYSQAKVLVNTSETEGICFSFLEAMAFKLPIITWDVGGNSGVVEDDKTGYLIPFEDIDLFARKIVKIITNNDLKNKMGNAGFIKLKKEFNIKKNVKKLLKVYEEVIKK